MRAIGMAVIVAGRRRKREPATVAIERISDHRHPCDSPCAPSRCARVRPVPDVSRSTWHRGRQTVLQRQLATGRPQPKATALDVFRLARKRFLAGERVEMGALAEELDLNRATMYRWVGS